MELLDKLTVRQGTENRYIELYFGDLATMPSEQAVDVLVVSAFPDDYTPTPRSLIGSLYQKGVSVAELAAEKAVDLRDTFSCWVSDEITAPDPGIQFKRVLCFEPLTRGNPPEVVGDVFQSLMPFVDGDPPIASIAMPLVASGDQDVPLLDMLEPLLDAAVHWLAFGLSVERLKIVEHSNLKAAELKGAFSVLKKKYQDTVFVPNPSFAYDLFISYSHQNIDEVAFLIEELQRQCPGIRIFLDRKDLNVGMAWQQEIFEALDDCRKVVSLYSPPIWLLRSVGRSSILLSSETVTRKMVYCCLSI